MFMRGWLGDDLLNLMIAPYYIPTKNNMLGWTFQNVPPFFSPGILPIFVSHQTSFCFILFICLSLSLSLCFSFSPSLCLSLTISLSLLICPSLFHTPNYKTFIQSTWMLKCIYLLMFIRYSTYDLGIYEFVLN